MQVSEVRICRLVCSRSVLHQLSAKHSVFAGIHVGLDALADQPVEKLRKQLEVNLVAQLIVTKVCCNLCCIQSSDVYSPGSMLTVHRRASSAIIMPF